MRYTQHKISYLYVLVRQVLEAGHVRKVSFWLRLMGHGFLFVIGLCSGNDK